VNLLSFASVYFSEMSLFKNLQAIQTKTSALAQPLSETFSSIPHASPPLTQLRLAGRQSRLIWNL
jgi:hypothetical protein